MSVPEPPEHQIVRIHGGPEQWLRDWLEQQLIQHAGKIYGVAVHLCLTDESGDSCGTVTWYDWPSKTHLLGTLQISAMRLAKELSE